MLESCTDWNPISEKTIPDHILLVNGSMHSSAFNLPFHLL